MSNNDSEHTARSKVLVALDGSPAAATALPLARVVARQLGARLEALHVTDDAARAAEVLPQLQHVLEETEPIQLRAPVHDPAAGILEAAADPNVVLLVLTTHGRAVEPGRQLGRVAEAVIAATSRPIIVVRPEAAAAMGARELQRLLLPLNGTPTTAAALRPVIELAGQLGASIDLLYVAAPHQAAAEEPGSIGAPRYVDQPQHEWPQWAQEVIERLCACLAQYPTEVPVRMYLAQGEIGAEIARFAATHGADAIVLVRRSHLEAGRARVLRAVLGHTPCPVLLVGAPA
ncbi:MAG TPA: universal stress protein [Chloroflexota bacterium]|nr:universal stress protein [Chloroflexota bacterium]